MPGGACTQMAIVRATDWATPGLFTNADLWPILSEDISNEIEQLQNDELGGCVEPGPADSGNQIVRGSITRYLHYEGDELALAVGLGSTSFVPGSPNVLTLTRQGDLTGLGITLFIDKGISVWKVDVAKVDQVSIAGTASDGRVMVTYTIIGSAMPYSGSDDFSTLTEPAAAQYNYVLFRHLQYMINGETDAALDPGSDLQKLNGFNLDMTNALAEDFRAAVTSEEPDRDGWGLVTGGVTIGKYTSNDRVAQFAAQTRVKQQWLFTGSGSYQMEINSPSAVLTEATPQIPGPGRIPHDYSWNGQRAVAVPSGMDAVDTHMVLDGVAADPLA